MVHKTCTHTNIWWVRLACYDIGDVVKQGEGSDTQDAVVQGEGSDTQNAVVQGEGSDTQNAVVMLTNLSYTITLHKFIVSQNNYSRLALLNKNFQLLCLAGHDCPHSLH